MKQAFHRSGVIISFHFLSMPPCSNISAPSQATPQSAHSFDSLNYLFIAHPSPIETTSNFPLENLHKPLLTPPRHFQPSKIQNIPNGLGFSGFGMLLLPNLNVTFQSFLADRFSSNYVGEANLMLIPFIKASPARLFPGINIGFAESNLFCWRTGVTWARSRF